MMDTARRVDHTDDALELVDRNGRLSLVSRATVALLELDPTAATGAHDGHAGGTVLPSHADEVRSFGRRAMDIVARGSSTPGVLGELATATADVAALHGCAVLVLDSGRASPHGVGVWGLPADYADRIDACWRLGAPSRLSRAYVDRRTVVSLDARRQVMRDRRFAPLHDTAASQEWHTWVAVPLIVHGRVLGVVGGSVPDAERVGLLDALGPELAQAVQAALLCEQTRAGAAIAERARIGRDLHDTLSQKLFSMNLQAGAALRGARTSAPHLVDALEELRASVRSVQDDLHEVVRRSRPAVLEAGGLASAVRRHVHDLAARTGLPVVLHCPDELPPLDEDTESDLFRIMQEALNNVVKHAQARLAAVEITTTSSAVTLAVRDDGVGLVAALAGTRFGLSSMRERVERHGGRFEIGRPDRGGTVVTATLPTTAGPTLLDSA